MTQSLRELLPQGLRPELESIDGLNSTATNLSAVFRVTGQLGTVIGKRMLMPGFLFSTHPRAEFVSDEKRVAPIDLHYAEQVIDDTVYHLPAGFTVESTPQPAQLPWAGRAQLVVKTASGEGTIEIKHVFARGFVLLDAKEYPALRSYYQTMATADQQQLVLVQNSGATGN
jgi:hypothetical protein